ncbi:MAG TPA: phage tail tape measure protein [Lachnospiraceae bacterium]|nr:phage tail tape measure protein [Lachnospiraceae bacterium]
MIDLGSLVAKIVVDSGDSTQQLENFGTQTQTLEQKSFSLKDSLKGMVGGLAIGAAVAGVAKGVVECVKKADELQKSYNTLQTQTGATDEEMGELEQTLKNIYANNYGEDFEDIALAMSEVEKQTGLTGEALQTTTENALALRDTFGYEVQESTRAADMMMKQFGITSDEAFNLIAQGSQNGLDKNGNLLDSINEYSVHFNQLGLDSEDMFNMFANGAKAGVFDIDKLGDAVKEFGIRAKDGSDTTIEAYESLGLNADELQEKFSAGGETANDAFKEVTNALNNCDDEVVKNTAGVNLFGTMWEDMGADAIKALSDTDGSISTTADSLNKIKEIKYDDLGSAFEGIGRQIEVGLAIPIGEKILPLVNEFANWINDHMPEIKAVIEGTMGAIGALIESLITTISALVTAAQTEGTYFNAVWHEIKIVFETVFKAIQDIFAIFTAAFKGDWKAVWEGVKTLISDVWNGIKALVDNNLKAIVTLLNGIQQALKNAAKALFNKIKDGFSEVWNNIKTWVTTSLTNLVSTITGVGSRMYSAGKAILTSMWNGLKDVWSSISRWVSEKVSWIADKVTFWNNSNSSMKKDGSHRTGLSTVPFDGYSAILHKGEMVLTQPEADRYREGNNTSTTSNVTIAPVINVGSVRNDNDINKISRELQTVIKMNNRALGVV